MKTKHTKLYNWLDLPREFVREGVERAGFRADNVIMVWNWITPGMKLNPHHHPFDQLALLLKGKARYHVGDEIFDMAEGSMLHIPPDVVHYIEPIGNETALNLDVFSPVRDDYKHLVEYQAEEFLTKRS
jgi:quercetin dioxygenase-like cupin family protein